MKCPQVLLIFKKYKNNHSKKIIFADKEICMPKKRPHCYFNFKPTDDSSKLWSMLPDLLSFSFLKDSFLFLFKNFFVEFSNWMCKTNFLIVTNWEVLEFLNNSWILVYHMLREKFWWQIWNFVTFRTETEAGRFATSDGGNSGRRGSTKIQDEAG